MSNPPDQPPQHPIAEAQNWIARKEASGWFRVIDFGNVAAGFVQINHIHNKNRFGWLGIALFPEFRGRGLGSSALAMAQKEARDALNLRKLLLEVRADNASAIKAYETAGWRQAGKLFSHYFDGTKCHDVLIYEKVPL